MHVTMLMVVRNEADIIGLNLRYHAFCGVSRFIITDHLSNDGTPEIIESFAAEGHDIILLRQTSESFLHSLWMTGMAQKACELGTDWVINCDADEFWWADGGLLSGLSRIPTEFDCIQAWWKNALYSPGENPMLTVRWVDGGMYKTAFRPHSGVDISVGSHWVYSSKTPYIPSGFRIYHYTDRSEKNVVQKYSTGMDSLEKAGYPEWVGNHWKAGRSTLQEKGFNSLIAYAPKDGQEVAVDGNMKHAFQDVMRVLPYEEGTAQ